MSKRVTILSAVGACCLTWGLGCGPKKSSTTPGYSGENIDQSQVLKRIETYRVAEPEEENKRPKESYDLRKTVGAPVPPSKTDALAADIWRVLTEVVKIQGLKADTLRHEHVLQALSVYLQAEEWKRLPGYRPWTHWSFVRSRRDDAVHVLAHEVVAYIKKNGVKDPLLGKVRKKCNLTCSISCRQPEESKTTVLGCAQVCKAPAASAAGVKPQPPTCAQCKCDQHKPVCQCAAKGQQPPKTTVSTPGANPAPRPGVTPAAGPSSDAPRPRE